MAEVYKKSRVNPSLIAIVVLSVLLIASIAIGATLAYFSAQTDVTGTITLGDPVNIQITQGGASVSTLTFTGDAMPGTVFDQEIGVAVPANTSSSLLRAKVLLTTETGDVEITVSTADAWQKGTDEYYYYNGVADASANIAFVETITVPTTLTNDDANKVYTVNVVVEAIQEANYAAASVWTTAPEDWIATYATAPAEG